MSNLKMYIPEIGDQIVLAADWHFNLHCEDRNVQLAALFGHYPTQSGWVAESDLEPMRKHDYVVNYPDRDTFKTGVFRKTFSWEDYDKARKQAEEDCPEFVKYWADFAVWKAAAEKLGKPTLPVCLPAGTLLSVDRIYIRKGVKDYSSVTFYAKNMGEVTIKMPSQYSWYGLNGNPRKAKSQRFWVKLADCNNIEFTSPAAVVNVGSHVLTVDGTELQTGERIGVYVTKEGKLKALPPDELGIPEDAQLGGEYTVTVSPSTIKKT